MLPFTRCSSTKFNIPYSKNTYIRQYSTSRFYSIWNFTLHTRGISTQLFKPDIERLSIRSLSQRKRKQIEVQPNQIATLIDKHDFKTALHYLINSESKDVELYQKLLRKLSESNVTVEFFSATAKVVLEMILENKLSYETSFKLILAFYARKAAIPQMLETYFDHIKPANINLSRTDFHYMFQGAIRAEKEGRLDKEAFVSLMQQIKDEMIKSGIEPDSSTYLNLLNIGRADMKYINETLKEMQLTGIRLEGQHIARLLLIYAKTYRLEEKVDSLIDLMNKRGIKMNSMILNAILSSYGYLDNDSKFEFYVNLSKERNLYDEITLQITLDRMKAQKNTALFTYYWPTVEAIIKATINNSHSSFKVQDINTITTIVEACLRFGKVKHAARLVLSVPTNTLNAKLVRHFLGIYTSTYRTKDTVPIQLLSSLREQRLEDKSLVGATLRSHFLKWAKSLLDLPEDTYVNQALSKINHFKSQNGPKPWSMGKIDILKEQEPKYKNTLSYDDIIADEKKAVEKDLGETLAKDDGTVISKTTKKPQKKATFEKDKVKSSQKEPLKPSTKKKH